MQLAVTTGTAASVALLSLLFPLHIHAQEQLWSQNITLRFYQTSQDDSCNYGTSGGDLTFTTGSIPLKNHCFDFTELFSGNASQGFVNQTSNLSWQDGIRDEAGIHWSLGNKGTFDPQANYSSVLYRQHVFRANNDENKPGHYSDRRVTLYPGKGCSEKDPNNDKGVLPWYGFSCWSEEDGTCGTMPYSIASFSLQPGSEKSDQKGKCWDFAMYGVATRGSADLRAVMVGFLSILFVLWLAM